MILLVCIIVLVADDTKEEPAEPIQDKPEPTRGTRGYWPQRRPWPRSEEAK